MSKTRKWYAKALYLVFALALVVGFSLTGAPAENQTVEASSSVSNVWVQLSDYADGGTTVTYYVYFTPGVGLTKDVDTITVIFPAEPSGTDTNASGATAVDVDADADGVTREAKTAGTKGTEWNASALVVSLTTPVDITAGTEAYVKITGVTNPTIPTTVLTKDYTLKIYTSQETTHATSSEYTIGVTEVTSVTFKSVGTGTTDKQAGKAACYNVTFTTTRALVGEVDTISITLPTGTSVPSSISTTYVHLEDADPVPSENYNAKTVTVSGRVVTICPYESFTAAETITVSFNSTAANIKNPQVANVLPDATTYAYTAYATFERYMGFVKTSRDLGLTRAANTSTTAYNVEPRAATKLGFSSASASLVGTSQDSTDLYLRLLDTYGNIAYDSTGNAEVDVSSSSATGKFKVAGAYHTAPTLSYGSTTSDYQKTFKYWDSTAGTATITASGTGGSAGVTATPYWTDTTTWDITVEAAHVVELYDASDNLVGTYTTIKAAVDDALAKYTVKVGPGTYKETATVPIDQNYVTVESTDGAETTIVDGYSLSAGSDVFSITGDYVTVKGLTFKDSKTTSHDEDMIQFGTGDNTTIQDCVFDLTAGYADDTGIKFSAAGNSVTVSGCTFNVEAGLNAIDMDVAATGLTVKNCTFNGSGTGSLTGFGYDGDGGATATFKNCTFDGTRRAIDLDTAGTVTVNGCTFTNGSKSTEGAIDVTATTTLTIYGCTFEDNAGYSLLTSDGDAIVARFNNFINNAKGMKNSDSANTITCDHNWWGDASGPTVATNPAGTGDIVSSYVTYTYFLGAEVSAADYTASGTSLDASSTVGVKVTSSSSAAIGVAKYASNPKETPTTFTPLEDGFFDVYAYTSWGGTDVVSIYLYSDEVTSNSKAYLYSEFYGGWKECYEQTPVAGSYVWVNVRPYDADHPEQAPVLTDLVRLVFAIGTPGVPVTLESISASPDSVSLSVGGTQALTVTATYSDASTADVTATSTYSSDDESVATVSAAGVITGVAEGSATITVSYTEGAVTAEDTVSVTVTVGPTEPSYYDEDGSGVIEIGELLDAIDDYIAGVPGADISLLLEVISYYINETPV